jgi:hypothetical protein
LKRGIGDRPSSLGTTTLYDTVTTLNAKTKESKQAVDNVTAGREKEVKRAVDEAMTVWHAEMASNLEATMAPMRGLFFSLSTDKDKPGDGGGAAKGRSVGTSPAHVGHFRHEFRRARQDGFGREGTPWDDFSQQVKSLEDEIVELKEQLESARVVVGGVSFNLKPQAHA